MSQTSLDIRQTQTRVLQDQIDSATVTQMDSVLASVNNELTPPGRLIAASTPSLVVTIGSGTVVNPNTSKNRVLPFINNTPVAFTGGTITFPSTSGTITVSPGTNGTITIGASQFVAVLVQLNTAGQLNIIVGTAAASLGTVVVPSGSTTSLSLGYIIVQSNGSSVIQSVTNAMLYQFVGGGGSGGGSGSGTGDDLDALQYQSDVTELFANSPTASASLSTVDTTQTNAAYSAANGYMTLSYDASKTVTGTGTAMTISATPSYTVAVGDILRVGTQARKITVVTTQTSYTIESAFTTNPATSACTISQAVYSKDLNNFAFNGDAISAIYTGTISDCLVIYNDTASGTNYNYTDPALIGYTASGDGSIYTTVQVREANPSVSAPVTSLASTGSNMYLRFFSNASSGTGTVNLVGYKAFFHRLTQTESGGIQAQAICFTNGAGTPVGCSNPTVVGGVTQIVLNTAYPVGVNSGNPNGSLRVYLNGQKIPRFINTTLTPDASYTEVNATTIKLDRNYSAQSYSVEIYQDIAVVDSNTQNTTNIAQIQAASTAGFQGWTSQTDFIITATSTTGTPAAGSFYSSIVGRAPMADLSQDVKPRFGIERFEFQQIQQIQNEFGPSNEIVWGTPNDPFGQIRFGGTWTAAPGTAGNGIGATNAGDFIEITFYGTGLNMLAFHDSNARNWTASVDGGTASGNLYVTGVASLWQRNYSPNTVFVAASGLALGIHTVKIVVNSSTFTNVEFYGFEIVNTNATPANISVNSGISYAGGQKLLNSSQLLQSYSSGVTGTTGGRMLVYQTAAGSIGTSFTQNATSASYLTSASHANEEVARTYYWREFGAGRSDDFSIFTSSPASLSFALDDGNANLVGTCANNISGGGIANILGLTVNGHFVELTFVGTGLDVVAQCGTAGGADTYVLTVDGTPQGNPFPTGVTTKKQYKLCSGLTYGTHTVKLSRTTAATYDVGFHQFVVYQPKTPSLPSGAVQIGSYNVMATYSANATAGLDTIGVGLLRKSSTRELVYTGSWSAALLVGTYLGGWEFFTTTNGSAASYTFFGTGFELRGQANTGWSATNAVTIDGTALTTANFPSLSSSAYGGYTFNASTGNLSVASSNTLGSGLSVSGLALGLHTVKIASGTSLTFTVETIDVITPIHSYKSNIYADIQNTLPIGSNSISDDRQTQPVRGLPSQKAWGQAIGVASGPTTTSTSDVPVPDMSVTVKTSGGALKISYTVDSSNSALTAGNAYTVYLDGVAVSVLKTYQAQIAGGRGTIGDFVRIPASAGTHNVQLYWHVGSGTGSANSTARILLVEEE